METIFEKPIILNGEKDNVVLVYSEYIIGNIKKEITDLIIEGIDNGLLNAARFESIVKIKEVFAYKFEPDNDSHITFIVKNVSGTRYRTIDFKDPEITKQAEILLTEQFLKLGFRRNEKHLTSTQAAISPLILTAIIAASGTILTWFSHEFQKYEVQTKADNWCLNLFMRLCTGIGYVPFLILTTVLLLLSLFWLFKRIFKPPYQISAKR